MPTTNSDALALLATTTGIAGVVWVLMQAIRRTMAAATFDRFAPIIAILLGVVLAILFVVATVNPVTSAALVGALISGILGGALSQNANTALTRMINPPTPPPGG